MALPGILVMVSRLLLASHPSHHGSSAGQLDDMAAGVWERLDTADLARQYDLKRAAAGVQPQPTVQCGLGEFWHESADRSYVTCAKCAPGRYKRTLDRQRCAMCPLGKFQTAPGAVGCMWCPSGRYQNRFGMDECRLCPHGKFLPYEWHYRLTRSECMACEQGKTSTPSRKSCFRPAWLAARTDLTASPTAAPTPRRAPQPMPTPFPTPVATASPTPVATLASRHAHLESCLPGSMTGDGGTVCQKCAPGKFQPRVDGEACATCPHGRRAEASRVSCYTSETVARTQECPAGTCWVVVSSRQKMHQWLLQCRSCEPGMFQPRAGQNACMYCPHGKYSDGAVFDRSSCAACPAGRFQSSFGQAYCHECPQGKYQPWLNRLSLRTSCLGCPEGRTSAPDKKSCMLKHASYFVSAYLCRAGKFWVRPQHTGDTACARCPRGKFQPRAARRACRTCPHGRASTPSAAGCEAPKPPPARPALCASGRFGRIGTLQNERPCRDCPAGKYQANAGVEECWACPAGQVSADDRRDCHAIVKIWSMHKGAFGASREHPAPSCLSVLLTTPHAVDGYYWLVLPSGRAINAYCLMSEGGWTRIAIAAGPTRAPMQPSAWQPLLGADYFAAPHAEAVTSDAGPRQDGFPNLGAFAFSAPLATFRDVPFREVLLHDGKQYLSQKTEGERITTMREVLEGPRGGVLPLHQLGKVSGFLHLQGAASQAGQRRSCFFPRPDGTGCAQWHPGDGGDEATSFHVANTAACRGWHLSKASDKQEDKLLWGGACAACRALLAAFCCRCCCCYCCCCCCCR
jgi:hypothetical protein